MLSIQKVRNDPCSARIRRAVLLKKRGGNTSATAITSGTKVLPGPYCCGIMRASFRRSQSREARASITVLIVSPQTSNAWLLRQIIQGTEEIGLARIGPSTSSGFKSLASLAASLIEGATAQKTGGSPPSGSASRTEEEPARPINRREANTRTFRSVPSDAAMTASRLAKSQEPWHQYDNSRLSSNPLGSCRTSPKIDYGSVRLCSRAPAPPSGRCRRAGTSQLAPKISKTTPCKVAGGRRNRRLGPKT